MFRRVGASARGQRAAQHGHCEDSRRAQGILCEGGVGRGGG